MSEIPKNFFQSKKFFGVKEVSEALGISKSGAWNLIKKGRLGPFIEAGVGIQRKERRVLSENVRRYVNGQTEFIPIAPDTSLLN